MRLVWAALLVCLAGCSSHVTGPGDDGQTTAAPVTCPLPNADYVMGTTFVHVTYRHMFGGTTDDSNVTVWLERGGNETTPGEPMANETTDSRGCASFVLRDPGDYRLIVQGPCGPLVTMLAWDRTFMDQVEVATGDCE